MCGLYFSTTDADNISLIRPFIEQRGRDEFNIQKKIIFYFFIPDYQLTIMEL